VGRYNPWTTFFSGGRQLESLDCPRPDTGETPPSRSQKKNTKGYRKITCKGCVTSRKQESREERREHVTVVSLQKKEKVVVFNADTRMKRGEIP